MEFFGLDIELHEESSSPFLFQKRSDIDIMAKILSEADEDIKKTRLMYRCNLSHGQLQVYLKILHNLGFLASHPDKKGTKSKYFRSTLKGSKFLDAYHALKSLMT